MNKKKWLYVLSAAILIYIGLNAATKFTIVSAPKQEDVESPIKLEKAEVNFAEIDLGNNLALNKKVIANNHTQTYIGANAADGDAKTYIWKYGCHKF